MRDTELVATWFEDVGTRVRGQPTDLDEDALAHVGEIDALLAIRERAAQRASA